MLFVRILLAEGEASIDGLIVLKIGRLKLHAGLLLVCFAMLRSRYPLSYQVRINQH